MSRTRRSRNGNDNLFAILLRSSWKISAGLAVATLVIGKWILPAMITGGNIGTKVIVGAAAGVAPFLAFAFAAAAVFAYIRERKTLTVIDGGKGKRNDSPPSRSAAGTDSPSHVVPMPTPVAPPAAWSLPLLQALEWKRFEDVCERFYRLKGITCKTTPLGPDGGVDIELFQDDADPSRATGVVQCKAWGTRNVGVAEIRELLGVMAARKIPKGFFMAQGGFTDEATVFGKENGIVMISGNLLLSMIQRLTDQQRKVLLEFAVAGDYTTPTCPSCGIKMVARQSKSGDFWGCANYPKCRGRLGMRKAAAVAA